MTLEQLRRRIDELDERLVALLNERASCALRIGEIKQRLGLDIYQPDRESQVLGHVREHGRAIKGPLSPAALTRLFERDRKSTRLNSSHQVQSRMPSSA